MTRLDDMKQALASLRRAAELMEQDVRREEGMETRLRNREEVNAIGDLVAEMFWLEEEMNALNKSATRRDDAHYRRLRELNLKHYEAKKRVKEWIRKRKEREG